MANVNRIRSTPSRSVVQSILLGDRCITPGRRARMSIDIQGTFGYPRDGRYAFVEADIPTLTVMAERGGQRSGEGPYGRDPKIEAAYRAILSEIQATGQAIVRLVFLGVRDTSD